MQGGARRGLCVNLEADPLGVLEGAHAVVNHEPNDCRHELRYGNGDDLDLRCRERVLPEPPVQHATHARRVVHGLPFTVDAAV